MNFVDAMIALKDGKEVCRPKWGGAWIYLDIADGSIWLNTRANEILPYDLVPQEDMIATDWSIVACGAAYASGEASVG